MVKGSKTLPPLGSDGTPLLPLQLLDVMAGDGKLKSGGGVSGTLQEREEHACWLDVLRPWKDQDTAAEELTSAWRRWGSAFSGQSSDERSTCDEHKEKEKRRLQQGDDSPLH